MFITTARAKQTQCKCCNSSQANLWDVCDFHNHCHQPHLGIHAPLTGVGIYYYRCDVCEFIFTKDFDHFGNKGFSQYIYNDDYPKLDIDYAEKRPLITYSLIDHYFSANKQNMSILDYGGGSGYLEKVLKDQGYQADTYEPFGKNMATPTMEQKYQIIVSMEVLEHIDKPIEAIENMLNYLDTENGIILFSTLLQPPDIETLKTTWWYINPRGGHISFYTRHCFVTIFEKYGFHFYTNGSNLHMACKNIPNFCHTFMEQAVA